ncbi:MAG: hypothetical protein R3C11_07825 [Planctomycetaceae bacterium]
MGRPDLDPPTSANGVWSQVDAAQLSNDVLVGKEGWLFFKGDRLLDDARGLRSLTEEELKEWAHHFKANKQRLAQAGISYLIVFVPNKATVYPEYLPDEIRFSESGRQMAQLVNYLQSEGDLDVLDLTSTLRAGKKSGSVYFRTDSHWNERGAFLAVKDVLQHLPSHQSSLPPFAESLFEEHDYDGRDLSRLLGLSDMLSESTSRLTPTALPQPTAQLLETETYHAGEQLHYLNPIRKEEAPRVGLFHDSFALDWIPWLAEESSSLTCCWSFGLDFELIEEERPQLVIHQIVERMIPVRAPAELVHRH